MSSVYSDPFSRPKPRFEKGDTVHFNDVQSSVRRKRTAQITNLRLTNNGYYEYQLLLEKGKGGFHGSEPNKNGQWVREKDLKLEKRAGIPASTKSNLEATHRQDIGKNRTRNSKVLAADKSANGPTRRKLTLSDYLSRRAKLAQMQSLGTSATPPITQSHPTSSSPVLGDKPPPLSLASTIYASVSREQQAAFIDPPPSPSADFPSELDESEGVYSSELSTLKCICSSSDNDGNTVRCEECNTSQHIKCYYESMVDPPIVHRCFDCSQGTFRSIRTVVERVDPQQLVTDHINNTYSPGERLLGNRKSISPPPSMQALPIPRFMTKDSTVDPSILSYSDSGYASVDPKSNKEWETVEFKNSISSDDNDTMSLYSVDPTPDAAKEAYIRELANDLMNQIVKEAESVDGILIDKICTELHRDLQAFARMTGDLGRSQEARDVMVFVSQHRQ